MIHLDRINKSFGDQHIIRNLSLSIEKGERICIIGPSGCGKSTILKLLVGLLKPDSGIVRINSQIVNTESESELHKIRRNVGFAFQSSALFDSINVAKNVGFALTERQHPLPQDQVDKIVAEKLALVGMSGFEDAMPASLSGGQARRVGIARALAYEPEIVLYDEPTAGLDPRLCHSIENTIVDLSQTLSVTSIVISHQISTMLRTAEKIYFMHEGRFLEPETPQSIQNSKQDPIRDFFKGEFNT
jgi:phospholipid/cholesterol/gamma-HCH transport system ATP-binding protein